LKYHVVFLTRHPDGIRLINDAFVKERRDVHGKSAAHTGQTGFPSTSSAIRTMRRSDPRTFGVA
jgi:hypothetical protein